MTDTTAHMDVTLRCNNDPSKSADKDVDTSPAEHHLAAPCDRVYGDTSDVKVEEPGKIEAEGAHVNLSIPKISPEEQPPPANGIKEQAASFEGRNQSDCSINPLTEQIQGTDTPTPIMECSLNNSLSDNYILNGINEQSASWEESNQSDYSIDPLTEQIQGTYIPTPIMGCSLNNRVFTNYVSSVIKEEVASREEGNQSDCSINPFTEQIQGTDTPAPIMGCSLNNSLSDNYIFNGINEQLASWERGNQSGINPNTPTPIMGYSWNNCAFTNYVSSVIKEEAASWEEGNQSDCSINPLTEQIQGTDEWNNRIRCRPHKHMIDINCIGNRRNKLCTSSKKTLTLKEVFDCNKCHKSFKSKGALVRHQKTHTGVKPFSCSQCGKCFAQSSDLTVHERTHTGEKPFACPECGKCFGRHSHLKVHQKVHTGDKPFACTECGKCFTQHKSLIVHQRIHSGLKPFSCSVCGKCFRDRSNLNAHERIHTVERAYPCSVCGKHFAHKIDLKLHQRIH
ncbi:oocyte zinc finger protein XlCOF29 isoform X3 [Xenopus laevis]|uniref:Oocyte zinc finger protein XlCOF29 isoform X3 n=1 Tax=Xenopus laevis TaxID=8355 RepID=A0A8J1LT77_XENLA|nr:oocyte zinc finger protein XlCOF29 isoform X3 [Xenopus laevis]